MAEFSFPFDVSVAGDRTVTADTFGTMLNAMVTNGVVKDADDALAVSQSGTPAMSVSVATGRAFVGHTSKRRYYRNTSALTLTIEAADGSNPRDDLIVLEMAEATGTRSVALKVVKGTAAGSPSDPSLTTTEATFQFAIARVRVGTGVSTIVNANITDLRSTNGFAGMALGAGEISQLTEDTIASGDFIGFSDESETGDPTNKITVDNLMETGLPLITEDTVAVASDYMVFLDGGASGNANKESIAHFVSAIAGTGLSESSGQLVVTETGDISAVTAGTGLSGGGTTGAVTLNVEASQAITALTGGDLTIYDDTNNADVSVKMGTGSTESLNIEVLNGASNKTAEEIKITTKTASGTANHGKISIYIDETEILDIDDGGIDLASGKTFAVDGTDLTASPITALNNATANELVTIGSTTTELDAEANLTFASNVLQIGADADIEPRLDLLNDESSAQIGLANAADDMVSGSADGDLVINNVGDHKIIIAQNDTAAITLDADGDVTFANNIDGGTWNGGTIGVSKGGTGATSLTANGVIIGNGTSALTSVDMSTKGHLLAGDGSGNPSMLSVGSNNTILTADSSEATGMKWAAASSGSIYTLDNEFSLTGSTSHFFNADFAENADYFMTISIAQQNQQGIPYPYIEFYRDTSGSSTWDGTSRFVSQTHGYDEDTFTGSPGAKITLTGADAQYSGVHPTQSGTPGYFGQFYFHTPRNHSGTNQETDYKCFQGTAGWYDYSGRYRNTQIWCGFGSNGSDGIKSFLIEAASEYPDTDGGKGGSTHSSNNVTSGFEGVVRVFKIDHS
jgi:hypothetical protein